MSRIDKFESIFDSDLPDPFTEEEFLALDLFEKGCAVVEIVLGWKLTGGLCLTRNPGDHEITYMKPYYKENMLGEKTFWYPIEDVGDGNRGFRPTSVLLNAVKVAERAMLLHGWELNLVRLPQDYWIVRVVDLASDFIPVMTWKAVATHKKLPMAICLALLKASGKMKEPFVDPFVDEVSLKTKPDYVPEPLIYEPENYVRKKK
jgi:hypothetical protein